MDLQNYLKVKQVVKMFGIAESTIRMAAKNNDNTKRFTDNELMKIGRDWFILKDAAEREWGKKRKVKHNIDDNVNL